MSHLLILYTSAFGFIVQKFASVSFASVGVFILLAFLQETIESHYGKYIGQTCI